jgi:hypothetical protein
MLAQPVDGWSGRPRVAVVEDVADVLKAAGSAISDAVSSPASMQGRSR